MVYRLVKRKQPNCFRVFVNAQFTSPTRHDKTVRTESVRPPDKCVLRRSASSGRTDSACVARHTPMLNALVGRSGRLSSHRHNRHDTTLLSVSCLVCRCEWDDCSERVQATGVDKGGPGGPAPPNGRDKKIFLVKIEGLSSLPPAKSGRACHDNPTGRGYFYQMPNM